MITKNRIMARTEATEYIKSNPGEYLKPDGKGTGYICPLCGSGTGKGEKNKGTGITTKDGIHFKCWSCCDIDGNDIIDIIALEHGINPKGNPGEAFRKAYEVYGIEINDIEPIKAVKSVEGTQTPKTRENAQNRPLGAKNDKDYTNYYNKCKEQLENSPEALEYIASRGISRETSKKRNLGYDPKWLHPNPSNPEKPGYPSKRIIIPNTAGKYTARATDPNINKDYRVMKVGGLELYNAETLQQDKPLFITEAEWEALSVIEVGGQAMALGSTTNAKKFIERLKADPPKAEYLIISMDNDDEGNKATADIVEYLQTTDILFLPVIISGKHKDINEALQADRNAVKQAVMELSKGFEYAKQYVNKQNIMEKESAKAYINQFKKQISENKKTKPIPTGFKDLDFILDGGLYGDSLYFIGSISSLGKTTLALQIADNVAQQGETALIFSLEMARTELMSKSMSRVSFLNSGGDAVVSATSREVMTGNYETIKTNDDIIYLTESEQREKRANILKSIEDYSGYSDRIIVHEGVGVTSIKTIQDTVKRFISAGIKPVVFIDYMQLISPTDPRRSEKQTLDETVMLLKQMARAYKIAIIGISSFNRESYNNPVSMASFKESGAIEYSSDILIGLQLKGVEEYAKLTDTQKKASDYDVEKLKSKYPREIQVKILKNRNGATGKTLNYNLYSKYNYFQELTTSNSKPEQPYNATNGKRPKR